MPEHEDDVIPFTIRERRRVDRTERAVSGYVDEGGVFVPGLLQNTADLVIASQRIKFVGYVVCGLAIANTLHLWGIADAITAILKGGK